MRIIFDYDHPPGSPIEGQHSIETTPGLAQPVLVSALGPSPVDVIQYIKALKDGVIPIAGTGWDVITKHPGYTNTHRLDALIGEIVRLNDAPSRAILGV